ncbi:MAG: hypothetical protein ACI9PY_000580 [Ascidiaceihabitans sp.]
MIVCCASQSTFVVPPAAVVITSPMFRVPTQRSPVGVAIIVPAAKQVIEDYNLTVGFRLSIVEGFFEWAFLIPMILIGFNPFQAIVALVLVAQYQHWVHTERVHKLGWLDEIFNTPSVHRVHHGSNRKYLDKNYGGILMIWDKLFGTFAREDEKVVYGLTRNIHTNIPIKITFCEFGLIWRDVKQCRTWGDRLRIIFGGLSWRPDYFKSTHSAAASDENSKLVK